MTSGKTYPPPTAPAKMTPSSAAAFVSSASEAGVRITSSLLPLTISSTRLVTVTGNASLPRRPVVPIRRRKGSSACSTGISRACSSIRKSRSPARSNATPRSAPIALTRRFAWPTDSRSEGIPCVPCHGHEPGRGDGQGQQARGDPDACLAGGADEGGGRGRRHLRGCRRRRLRLPGVHARLRRGREPLQAPRAARADGQAPFGARLGASCEHARPPAAAVPLVAEGHGDARAHRAATRPQARSPRRDQGDRERRLAQVLPDPDEPVVHIYAEGKTRERSTELEAELRGLVEGIMQAGGAEAGVSS